MFDRANEVVLRVTRFDVLLMIFAFICIISIISILAVYTDKMLAIQEKRRIPEKTLYILALLGGSLAEYFTMRYVRHKTLHKKFMIGLPIIFGIQAALFIWWVTIWF